MTCGLWAKNKVTTVAARTVHEFTALLEALDRRFDEVINRALLPACGNICIVVEHAAVVAPFGGVSVHAPAFTDLADLHPVEDICIGPVGVIAGGMLGVGGGGRLRGAVLFIGLLGCLGGLHCGKCGLERETGVEKKTKRSGILLYSLEAASSSMTQS